MKSCHSIQEKIPLFEALQEEAKHEIRRHASECERCRQYFVQVRMIMSSLANKYGDLHPSDEVLTRYGIHLSDPGESDYDGRRLTKTEIGEIEKHLENCSACQKIVEELQQEFQEIESYLERQGVPSVILGPALAPRHKPSWAEHLRESISRAKDRLSFPAPQFVPVAVGALAILTLVVLVGPYLSRSDNPYVALASLEGEKFTSLTRSAVTVTFGDGLEAFHQQRYRQALEAFEQFISQNESDPNLYYAHYLAGMASLNDSREMLFGRFQRFNRDRVENGIQHLQSALEATEITGVREDCLWYMAKAHLMIENAHEANTLLEQVIELRGRRFREAKQLISEIDNARRSQ